MRVHFGIDWQVPRPLKYGVLVAAPLLVLVAGGALVYANVPNVFTKGQPLTAQALNDNFAAVSIPAGTVVAFAGPTVPNGWLLCDGSAVSRTTYGSLFAAIGTVSGSGDGATTFNLPDYRGRFLRGVDGDAGVDPDNASRAAAAAGGNAGDLVGSTQPPAFANHSHPITDPGHQHTLGNQTWGVASINGGPYLAFGYNGTINNNPATNPAKTGITSTDNSNTGGSETRPVNTYVNYIVKF
jgi:microcystin-dependent protein